jgi:KDO2-lipid IV(A) lauroyltransferase
LADYLFIGKSLGRRVDRSSWLQKAIWSIETGGLAALLRTSGSLSPERASDLGRHFLMRLGPKLPLHKNVIHNLRLAFPERNATQIETVARESWGNLGSVLAEYAHLERICDSEADDRLETVVQDGVEVFRRPGARAVFVTAHLANWEVSPAAATRLGIPGTVIYAPMRNVGINRLMLRQRQALGCEFLGKDAGAREILRRLSAGRSLGLLTDSRSNLGKPVPFFRHDMLTTVTPARLALRFGCELIPVRVQRTGGARFRVTFFDPIEPDDKGAPSDQKIIQMTRQINAIFETWIREQPSEWLWTRHQWYKNRVASTDR